MKQVAVNFNFSVIEKVLGLMLADHSESALHILKDELNKFFIQSRCSEVLYTENTDKMFFGIKVVPNMTGNDAVALMGDGDNINIYSYYLELDSKLFDPMLILDEKELTAIVLHEIYNIIYNDATMDEMRKQIDMYFTRTDSNFNMKASKGYRELLAYAMKDSLGKIGSIFSRIGIDEIVSNSFIDSIGYGAYLASAFDKIIKSEKFIGKEADDRLITMGWVLRLNDEFKTRRVPAMHTIAKAKEIAASELEQREIGYALNLLSKLSEPIHEGFFDGVRERFSKKLANFKAKGVRTIRNDVYELNVRLRCAESEEDLLYIIRTLNTDIAIIRDYLTEELSDEEREECLKCLQDMYDIRENAAKKKEIRDNYSSLIQIVYPKL